MQRFMSLRDPAVHRVALGHPSSGEDKGEDKNAPMPNCFAFERSRALIKIAVRAILGLDRRGGAMALLFATEKAGLR